MVLLLNRNLKLPTGYQRSAKASAAAKVTIVTPQKTASVNRCRIRVTY